MSSYFTRLAARLAPVSAPVSAPGRQGATPLFRSGTDAQAAREVPGAEARSVASNAGAFGVSPGQSFASTATLGFDTAAAGSAPRGVGLAPGNPTQTPFHIPLAHAGGRAAPTSLPPAGRSAPQTGTTITQPLTQHMARRVIDAAPSHAPSNSHADRLPGPPTTFETEGPSTQQFLAQPGLLEPRSTVAVDHDAAAERLALPLQDAWPAGASGPAQPAEPTKTLAERHMHRAMRPATEPRSQRAEPRHHREPTAPRIDVHIGTITLTVRAPAPTATPAPQAAPRPEPRPAFSASRHYLRCP